ncbi:unnamed protein product [Microthlaspi erraticum]|uniref:Uncharacterized protein n=1 Tax=Microthlaspi erraticum TaxID=1685480 RepID=A0A6D2K1V8_9BRAS|nr:unnamed protein product [Microthlaspi erraticum]
MLASVDAITVKRSYNQKSEDCPDGSIENQRPTAQSGWPRNECSRSAKSSVRLKSRPKSKPSGRYASRPGKHCPAVGHSHAHHDDRASREQRLAAAPFSRTTADAPSEPGSYARVRPRNIGQFTVRPQRPTESVRPRPFRLGHDPIVRPIVDRPTPRSTRSPF